MESRGRHFAAPFHSPTRPVPAYTDEEATTTTTRRMDSEGPRKYLSPTLLCPSQSLTVPDSADQTPLYRRPDAEFVTPIPIPIWGGDRTEHRPILGHEYIYIKIFFSIYTYYSTHYTLPDHPTPAATLPDIAPPGGGRIAELTDSEVSARSHQGL